jgi:hypothetical protein
MIKTAAAAAAAAAGVQVGLVAAGMQPNHYLTNSPAAAAARG